MGGVIGKMMNVYDLMKVQEVVESKLTPAQIKQVSDSIMKKAKGDKKLYYAILTEASKDKSLSAASRLTVIYLLLLYKEVDDK